MAAATSSSGAARGVRILDPEEVRRRAAPWTSLGVDGADREEEAAGRARARARECDVYVGHGGDARRMAAWLRAELELLGVPCVAADRRRCGDAPAHAAARAAVDAAVVGVVLVTPTTLRNPYAVEEVRAFLDRGALVPVFVGVRRGDFVAEDVVAGRGDLWEKYGGHLWMAYDGLEEEWREAVEGLARAEPAVEVRVGDLRDRVLDVLEILGARLGRRAMSPAVRAWRAEAGLEIPFPWNTGFVGREKELLDLESMLRGGARAHDKASRNRPMHPNGAFVSEWPFLDGAVCISGASGAGKTELALEFAHRHWHEYKKVLWVHGEARYLRQSYLKLADHLGIAVGDSFLQSTGRATARSLHNIEGDAIAKINKELARDIPYLVVIDNLESEKDWWDRRAVGELLPRGCRRTRVIVTTWLAGGIEGVRTLALGDLDASNAMRLMKGSTRALSEDDTAILRDIQETVGGVPLGLALVGAMLSEVPIGPAELRGAMRRAPHRAPTWEARDDAALRDNLGLVQLLDACFALLGREAAGLEEVSLRLLEASSFFAPVPIPAAMLVDATHAAVAVETPWKRFKRTMKLPCASPRAPSFAGSAEQEALAMLLRLGVVRRSTREGCVSVHGVFRLFSRKIGSGRAARAVVDAVAAAAAQGGAARNADDHTWAACLSLFRFDAPAASVELPAPELARFVTGSVLPLAARCLAGYSACGAALELLREATDGVFEAEEKYVGAPRRSSNGGAYVELDPKVYRELARARAELLVARARVMMRAGERAVAKDNCQSAINILEVVSGDWHPATLAVRAFLEQDVLVQTMNGVEPTTV
ncbi:uncharacterized protein C2845_PM18G09990 [Panicum miliaceum]|uniref:Plant disease resistance WDH domain-containing protein n=1 Tax=Panicum miliaceum TaxID=4540 RepID=A0A3L6PHQ8_PANMI|nr:uncharacterized protein C2845_PM18G09990 [Panicum miliaceum]